MDGNGARLEQRGASLSLKKMSHDEIFYLVGDIIYPKGTSNDNQYMDCSANPIASNKEDSDDDDGTIMNNNKNVNQVKCVGKKLKWVDESERKQESITKTTHVKKSEGQKTMNATNAHQKWGHIGRKELYSTADHPELAMI